MTTLWQRAQHVATDRMAHIALVVLTRDQLPEPLPVSRSRHGMPQCETAEAVTLRTVARRTDPAWFAEFFANWNALLQEDLGAIDSAAPQFAYLIDTDVLDPPDLGHLQAAWALAKCACEVSEAWVADLAAGRAWHGRDIAALDPGRPFGFDADVTVLVHDETAAAIVTRGLGKVARPDFGLGPLSRESISPTAFLVRRLASALADGLLIELDDTIQLGDTAWIARPATAAERSQFLLPVDALWLESVP